MERLFSAHARLKQRIHGFRLPIRSRAGLLGVSALYFSAPCAFGYWLMLRTIEARDRNLGANREKLLAYKRAAEVGTIRAEPKAIAATAATTLLK